MAGLALLVRGRHDAHEALDPFVAPAPVVGSRVFGDVGGPGFGVEGAKATGKDPVFAAVVVEGFRIGAGEVSVSRGHDDEGGVGAGGLGDVKVAAQGGGDEADVTRFGRVVGVQEEKVKFVCAVATSSVDAREGLHAVVAGEELGDEVFVGLTLPCAGGVFCFHLESGVEERNE